MFGDRPPAILAAVVLLSLGVSLSARAQRVTQPAQAWRTFQTAHFDFHAPAALEAWTRHVAARMESYAAAVSAIVGNSPKSRVTVLVDDPTGDANGYAVPLLDRPVIVLWPTPPTPSLTFGEHRGWGEILALHEYAHIAHLTYASRSPRERFWWSLLPARVGPVARKTPPWAFEGYATLIEGRLTGLGRPHSAGRAAVLRQWALSGKLPAYSALDDTRTFLGGAMRYLVGSAFLEWLTARKGGGDASLEHVWRRLSAREPRSFAAAFAGVYGVPPSDLYGEFVVDLTERALHTRNAVKEIGVREGELFQRLAWGTGDPAVSHDGQRVAVVLRQPNVPSRVVIWRTGPEGVDSSVIRRRARILARDSLDVMPFDSFPLPRRAEATLRAPTGGGYNNARWLPDGTEILLSREMPLGNGGQRPDLFLWNWRTGRVRRVTHGGGMRYADPAPDGRRAVATRCASGRCGLVIVTLADGTWRELVPGTFEATWHRPRWSRDGQRIAASVQRDGRWQVAVIDATTGAVRIAAPNDLASQHSPVWVGPDILAVTDRGGIPNLDVINVDSGTAHAATNVLGAVMAPEYSRQDSSVWYLDLHSNGLDVRRLRLSAVPARVELPARLAPIAPLPRTTGRSFDSTTVAARGYGVGPRDWRYLPGFGAGADGWYGLLALSNYDPAGKLGVLAQGAYGQRRAWRGGSLGIAWRGWSAFDFETHGFATQFGAPQGSDNPRFSGGALSVGRAFDFGSSAWSWLLGASGAELRLSDSTTLDRRHAHAEVTYAMRRSHGLWRNVQLRAYGSTGETADIAVRRGIASLGFTAGLGALRLRLSASGGRTTVDPDSGTAAASFEAFNIGGLAPPLFDDRVIPQRLSLPALPTGSASGRSYAAYRAALSQSGLAVSLYAAWFKLYDPNGNWQRLVGVDGAQGFPSIGFASLPNITLHYGAAYSIDHPRRHRWTLHGGARFAP